MTRTDHGSPMPGARFVDPAVLARIGNLELLARSVVDGFINGLHRSPYFGASVDFAEHRGYTPGDDIRRVDWRLYARTDRYYVKQYEADSNANVAVLLDVSRSMEYGTGAVSKLDYGRYLAACLSYFAHRQRDRIGLVTFDSEIVEYVPPSAKHLDAALHALDRAEAGRPGRLGPPLRQAAEHFGRRGILVLVSDLYEEPDAVMDAVLPLHFRGHDLIVFHVLDRAELEFTFDEPTSFQDLESDEQLSVVPETLIEQYRALVDAHVGALAGRFSENRVDYTLCNTMNPLDQALFTYLSARERLNRVR